MTVFKKRSNKKKVVVEGGGGKLNEPVTCCPRKKKKTDVLTCPVFLIKSRLEGGGVEEAAVAAFSSMVAKASSSV